MRRATRPLLIALVASIAGPPLGCAFEDGRGFARLSVELHGELAALDAAAGRLQPDGWIRTAEGFDVRVDELSVQIASVAIFGGAESSVGEACHFDPAAPPAGCSSCHGGHCHCGDALVSYEELEAQLCGGAGGTTGATAWARLGERQPTVEVVPEGDPVALRDCSPDCELPRGELKEVQLALVSVALRGAVRDLDAAERLGGEQPPIAVELALGGAALKAVPERALVIDRDTPYQLHLGLHVSLAAQLLDGVAWEALQRTGQGIVVSSTVNVGAHDLLRDNVSTSALELHVWRDGVELEHDHEHEGEH